MMWLGIGVGLGVMIVAFLLARRRERLLFPWMRTLHRMGFVARRDTEGRAEMVARTEPQLIAHWAFPAGARFILTPTLALTSTLAVRYPVPFHATNVSRNNALDLESIGQIGAWSITTPRENHHRIAEDLLETTTVRTWMKVNPDVHAEVTEANVTVRVEEDATAEEWTRAVGRVRSLTAIVDGNIRRRRQACS